MYKNQLDKEEVLITGCCGRLGSALAEKLLKLLFNGCKVLIGDINKNNHIKLNKKHNSSNLEIFAVDLILKKLLNFKKYALEDMHDDFHLKIERILKNAKNI